MQKVTKAIITLILSYILLSLYAFGVFLQQPLIKGESLTIQATLEPFAYVLLMVIGNFLIFKAVYSQKRSKNRFFDERKLLAPTIIFLLLLSFGAGIHTAGQLIEETFVNTNANIQHFTDNFTSQVAYFFEEYPAHFLIALPYLILLYFVAKLELNRPPIHLKNIEKGIIVMSAILYGIIFAVLNAEGQVTIFAIIIAGYLIYSIYRSKQQIKRELIDMPFSTYFVIGNAVMILLNVLFGIMYGWSVQPTELGFGS
ncbi:MAG: hypothetical protein A3B74_04145 [Candidatus Kerfeldbacteria bacterium RIFCSPHIGHO2_02_FULL_42_14]|uniref:Uncharacterized protein n=1 Tax=Candidatus Kerfeldbacteria bacterium RIFCSPHIGHO2_02_FULL_42_14 TaxID=1798540 RepID=A0A1G2AQY4_9BACT|nr:MAG: hypothetical protein A3B74_04145 [Candidatus Kerfeldbacteria bacterium RIFCSPHIGHO2_02_FULL_42_14]OGY80698.1 MAG: hypothetical protein A3E60_04640 [Candidatus Kerfeldbacteria bacterium RIFCSPHIGHO2_12_FULL_42_13]OGY82625.1 MAG: hypothetical protein A3I91_04305 [Candidatus Kerfeldbacteria bacterium RIFCSPLOWO2_02_FULL_42_19]OGY85228.1 MAG: hypothetical protein A3G01_01435 [Candidatus Kerfeldbacteria bacterium RIFCSPLOWO2_12_FULL_43_9]